MTYVFTIQAGVDFDSEGYPSTVTLHNAGTLPTVSQHQIMGAALRDFGANRAFVSAFPLEKGKGWAKFEVINRGRDMK